MTENQSQLPEQKDKRDIPVTTENIQPVAVQYGAQSGSPGSNLPAESSPEPDSQHQTSDMEVHHAHHPFHKKKWIEYLLEFFMLFLAVFLGFLVDTNDDSRLAYCHQEADSLMKHIKVEYGFD